MRDALIVDLAFFINVLLLITHLLALSNADYTVHPLSTADNTLHPLSTADNTVQGARVKIVQGLSALF